MSIKHFCDCCGNQIDPKDAETRSMLGRLHTVVKGKNGHDLGIEVVTAKDGTWNGGDFCRYCVLDALYRLDDRPIAVAPAESAP